MDNRIPQYLLLSLALLSLLLSANTHGKPKKAGTESFWSSAIGWVLQIGLMYWAGLFHWLF